MHTSISSHPEWQAFQDRREQLAKARSAATNAAAAWDAECARLRAEHADAVRRAIDAGEPPPPPARTPPDRPDVAAALNATSAELATIADAERKWLASHADDLLAVLHREERRLIGEAKPLVEVLNVLLPEWSELVETADRLRMAKGESRPANVPVSVGTVADAVMDGRGWVPRPEPAMPPPPVQPMDMDAYRRRLADGQAKLAQRMGRWSR